MKQQDITLRLTVNNSENAADWDYRQLFDLAPDEKVEVLLVGPAKDMPVKHYAVPCVLFVKAVSADDAYGKARDVLGGDHVIDEELEAFEYDPLKHEIHSANDVAILAKETR